VDRIYAAKYKPVEGSSEHGNEGLRLVTALNPLTSTATINFPRMFLNFLIMDPCVVDYSVEISTRCSFIIEFIIPKFTEGSTCFERHTAHHQEL